MIIITKGGYMKRVKLDEFSAQGRATRGKAGAAVGAADVVEHFAACHDHDTILFLTEAGVAYSVRGFNIPLSGRVARGVPLISVLPLSGTEKIAGMIACDAEMLKDDDTYLVLLTEHGWIKKTPASAFAHITSRGLAAIKIEKGDRLGWALKCTSENSIILATRGGCVPFSFSLFLLFGCLFVCPWGGTAHLLFARALSLPRPAPAGSRPAS